MSHRFDVFEIGRTLDYGKHTFDADSIIAFARQFDPQPFHIDAKAAENSIFGKLCASGWHTVSVWMRLNVDHRSVWEERLRDKGMELPRFGPSPGFRNLKWPKPVFAGDTVHYSNAVTGARALASRPGWGIVELHSEGANQDGELVLTFDSAALFELP